jgi:hypothetical protein
MCNSQQIEKMRNDRHIARHITLDCVQDVVDESSRMFSQLAEEPADGLSIFEASVIALRAQSLLRSLETFRRSIESARLRP